MPKITVIYGGPGTGKTHRLLDELALRLKTVPANKIAYVSFTRKGTYQGVDLAKEQFNLTDDDCLYFKTLHSLAYHSVAKNTIVSKSDLSPVMEKLNLTKKQLYDLVQRVGIAQNKQKDLEFEVDGLSFSQQKFAAEVYVLYKQMLNKIDYTDMLLLAKEQHITLPVSIAFIDEAQDLTTLQWQVVWQFFKDTDELIVAGDPNQAIFEWAGADVAYFLKMRVDASITLEKSYRCSKAVWALAKTVYACIQEKAPIPDKCAEIDGFALVSNTAELPEQNLYALAKKGTVYCLATQNSFLDTYIDFCEQCGIPYAVKLKGNTRSPLKERAFAYLKLLYLITTDPAYHEKYIARNANHPRSDSRADRYLKERLAKDGITKWHFGSETALLEDVVAFIKTSIQSPLEQAFALRAFTTGNIMLNQVLIANIHQVKGGEADYVLLCDNFTSPKIQQAEKLPSYKDYLLRMLYVAVTRAKQGIVVWHKNAYKTVAPTYLFADIGVSAVEVPILPTPIVEQIIKDRITSKEDTNA